jgi:phosphoenolpyruvate phosphomutase
VAERLRGVGEVVPQLALDYSENLLKYRPDFVVHGTDWRNGPQAKTRQRVIDLLATWGGVVVEPEYTKDVSTTDIIRKCFEYEKQRKEGRELSTEELARWEELKEARQVVPPDMALEPPLLARITAARPLVYVAVSNDFIHHGHVRIISEAAKLGTVVVALLTDGAVEALKGSSPVTPFAHRRVVFEAVNNVSFVIAQASPDYTHNLQMLRPEFVVHGDDWRDGPQRVIRLRVEAQLREWGGRLIEPKYTELALADSIIDTCYDRVSKQQEKQQKASAQ